MSKIYSIAKCFPCSTLVPCSHVLSVQRLSFQSHFPFVFQKKAKGFWGRGVNGCCSPQHWVGRFVIFGPQKSALMFSSLAVGVSDGTGQSSAACGTSGPQTFVCEVRGQRWVCCVYLLGEEARGGPSLPRALHWIAEIPTIWHARFWQRLVFGESPDRGAEDSFVLLGGWDSGPAMPT